VDPSAPFVPADFVPPSGLVTEGFVLEPLGPSHNEADYAAWTSSIPHIQATPGFAGGSWPHEMNLAENLGVSRCTTGTSPSAPGSPTAFSTRLTVT